MFKIPIPQAEIDMMPSRAKDAIAAGKPLSALTYNLAAGHRSPAELYLAAAADVEPRLPAGWTAAVDDHQGVFRIICRMPHR